MRMIEFPIGFPVSFTRPLMEPVPLVCWAVGAPVSERAVIREANVRSDFIGVSVQCEIGQILHSKSEIRNCRLDGRSLLASDLRFRILDLKCRICPISQFLFLF